MAFFVPLYTVEMLRQVLTCCLRLENFSEAFSIVARAPDHRRVEERPSPGDAAGRPVLDAAPGRPR
jgi:hypothetical protein